MSIVKSEFALALNQVATERGISVDDVLASIESAILAAYKKEMHEQGQEISEEEGEDEGITVKVNRETGEAHLFKDEQDITPPGFGRIAAQTAKQVTLQKIREVEKQTVITHYKSQLGTIVRGRVIRFDGYNAFVDIGKVEAVLPKEEQIKNENYTVNTSMVFYIKEIGEDKFGNSRIIVSRTNPNLLIELFKKEVPEITNGTVDIKNVAREPGERAKIAVYSSHSGVDPVGACVGQKGVRVQTVTNELGGEEKIDIIQWNKDEQLFLIAALSPAKIQEVVLDEKTKKAKVTVDETQAPLAIGKGGINVNLASKLTGYEIDIVQVAAPQEEKLAQEQPAQEAEVKPEAEAPKEPEAQQPVKAAAKDQKVQEEVTQPQPVVSEVKKTPSPQEPTAQPKQPETTTQTAETVQKDQTTLKTDSSEEPADVQPTPQPNGEQHPQENQAQKQSSADSAAK